MNHRQGGFTLIEILVVITIIAALVGLVTLLIPKGEEAKQKTQCLNNLRGIGGVLVERQGSGKNIRKHSGAAFLLQIIPAIKTEQYKTFICPGETAPAGRPDAGTEDFITMYKENKDKLGKLDEEMLHKMCSYAGPNWTGHPYNPASSESRLWGCDACSNRIPHHPGIVVLWDDGSTKFIDIADLQGQEEDRIYVGPDSGDKRLGKMIFYPQQR
jgi:prepilin-type N-terminal cleavage/methylation domain-containing protein